MSVLMNIFNLNFFIGMENKKNNLQKKNSIFRNKGLGSDKQASGFFLKLNANIVGFFTPGGYLQILKIAKDNKLPDPIEVF